MPFPLDRFRDGALQVPIYNFAHPETGSSIDLVGTIHVGDATYYQAICEYVENREAAGSLVHYEYIRPATEEEATQFPEEVVLARRIRPLVVASLEQEVKPLGLTHQKDAIPYAQKLNWKNHDISEIELVRMLGAEATAKLVPSAEKAAKKERRSNRMKELGGEEGERKAAEIAIRMMPIYLRIGKVVGAIFPRQSQRVIVDHRNQVALQAIDQDLARQPDQDITGLWAPGHLPGIGKGLKRRGYKLQEVQWLDAIRLRPPESDQTA